MEFSNSCAKEPLNNSMAALQGLARAAARRHAPAMAVALGKHDNAAAVRARPCPEGPPADLAGCVALS